MKSLRHLYKIGNGPSSSHTMGPEYASQYFISVAPDADKYEVILYGSLALTGKGHLTDVSIKEVFDDRNVKIVFNVEEKDLPHENTMDFIAYKNDEIVARRRVMSIGGGDIRVEGEKSIEAPEIYSETCFKEIEDLCLSRNIRLCDYVYEREDEGIKDYLAEVWNVMKAEIQAGLTTSGVLPGGLNVERVAQLLYGRRHIDESPETRQNRIVCAYAFAAAEQNASCGRIVTAPTCALVPFFPQYSNICRIPRDSQMKRSSMRLRSAVLSETLSSRMLLFPVQNADVRRRLELLARWLLLLFVSSSKWE